MFSRKEEMQWDFMVGKRELEFLEYKTVAYQTTTY